MPFFAVHVITECVGCIFSSSLAFLGLFKAQWEAMGRKYIVFNHVEEGEGKTKVSVLLTKLLIQLHSLYPKLILQIKHILDSYRLV